MMVTFVSQCEKNALKKTRRVLDAFANRIGDNTWQTIITQEGLDAVRKLLRHTASKSTAVSCHWIRTRARSEFIWVVGNRDKFNSEGYVAVNSTSYDIDKYTDSSHWKNIEIIKSASSIAGLFHDFGKANKLFQVKINPNIKSEIFEPYRHEWISARLFQAFVGKQDDTQWLKNLCNLDKNVTINCFKDGLDKNENHVMIDLPPFAKLISWLIVSHHKLALFPKWKQEGVPELKFIEKWFKENFEAVWNSYNCKDANQNERLKENWNFDENVIPFNSAQWRSHACIRASKTLIDLKAYSKDINWLDNQLFTSHISRLCLTLADHYYSSLDKDKSKIELHSDNYNVYANSTKEGLKQYLDEHLIAVAHYSDEIAIALPKLNNSLNSLSHKDILVKNVSKEYKKNFEWQDKATKEAKEVAKKTKSQGFFGINMASTGKGKTLTNAKIMNAIGTEIGRTRFSIALGLRTLTLQTGKEYRNKFKNDDTKDEANLLKKEIAIAVGGISVKQLFENNQKEVVKSDEEVSSEQQGSESINNLKNDELSIHYDGAQEHSLSKWVKQEKNLDKLISAPVLVCTIDHLIPATEGVKGGKQIAPMLRLLTSDLVLDEPDDFGLEDLPALCRLVQWAGLLGSRVLLSTATMPPYLAYALYLAYKDGWSEFAKANLDDFKGEIVCAWFDEFKSESHFCSEIKDYQIQHNNFVKNRVKQLETEDKNKRLGKIVNIELLNDKPLIYSMAKTIQTQIIKLHQSHKLNKNERSISIGLVRFANINPLVANARELLKLEVSSDTTIHYCIYHSKFPLAIRSSIEEKLDDTLNRKDHETIWTTLEAKLQETTNHIFVVLASPVEEVGRDHDFDWAIVEPSSMRSIIQLAGRVLRHRNIYPESENVVILNKNYKALKAESSCFERPGFEIQLLNAVNTHDLNEVLDEKYYKIINSIPRITEPDKIDFTQNSWSNLVELEHKALKKQLFSKDKGANKWWKNHPMWCGEMQRQQKFRNSKKDESMYRWIKDDISGFEWKWKNENVFPAKIGEQSLISTEKIKLEISDRNKFWFEEDEKNIYNQLASDFKIDLEEVSRRFGEVRLVEWGNNDKKYKYHPNLGLFKEIGGNNG